MNRRSNSNADVENESGIVIEDVKWNEKVNYRVWGQVEVRVYRQ